jgi:hypothetical protein
MRPWIIDRIEEQRREEQWQRLPLRIQQPPPEWIEEQERRERQEDEEPGDRGVTIIQM